MESLARTDETRSDWAFDETYRALNYRFRIQSDPADAGLLLHRVLAQFEDDDKSEGLPTYRLRATPDDSQVHLTLPEGWRQSASEPPELLDYVLWSIYMESIKRCGDYLALHAAAASLNGLGIAFPAEQNSGKSTLVAGLTRAGFDYLTDEATLVDLKTGRIDPYPKSICLGQRSMDALPGLMERLPREISTKPRPQYHVAPDELRAGSIGGSAPLRLAIFPKFRRSQPTVIATISKAEGMYTLLEDSWNFSEMGSDAFESVTRLMDDVECFRLDYGDLSAAVDEVRKVAES